MARKMGSDHPRQSQRAENWPKPIKSINRAIRKDSYFHKSICLPITSKYSDKIGDTNEKVEDKSVSFIRF